MPLTSNAKDAPRVDLVPRPTSIPAATPSDEIPLGVDAAEETWPNNGLQFVAEPGENSPVEIVTDVAVDAGQPLYVNRPSTHARLASAAALPSSFVVGLAAEPTAPGHVARVATETLTLADWTAAVGAALLVPGALYFLSVVAGMLTTYPPTTVGQCAAVVGVAVTTTLLRIEPTPPVLL